MALFHLGRGRGWGRAFADGILDNVIDDVCGSIVNPAGLAHFRLFLDLGLVPGSQADDLAQELLVDLSEDVRQNISEHIRAFRVI